MLRETESLEEQGDILQHLVDTQGLDFNTGKHGAEDLSVVTAFRSTLCFEFCVCLESEGKIVSRCVDSPGSIEGCFL